MAPAEEVQLILDNLHRITNLTNRSFELDCTGLGCDDCIFYTMSTCCYVTSFEDPEVFSIVHSYIKEHHPELFI